MRAVSPFTVDDFAGDPAFREADDGRVQFARAHIEKTFGGDLVGTGSVDMMSVTVGTEGAAYVALEWIEGTLHGKTGGFALLHAADDELRVWRIAPGSGAGDLTGIRGRAEIDIDESGAHTLNLDYELDELPS
jgi:hypothetical protein